MSIRDPFDQDEAFALDAYAALPPAQPPHDVDVRIRAAAHAANASRRPRRWATGLATAAVAVLAVGVAWRGLESNRVEYAPAADPPAAPTLQPAFKLETFESRIEARDTTGDDEGARAEPGQPPAEPAMSSADWKDSSPGRDTTPPARRQAEPEARAGDVVEPVFDEPMPMSEPAPPPPPPAPPLPTVPAPILEQAAQAPVPEAMTEARRQRPSATEAASASADGDLSARAEDDSGGLGSDAGAYRQTEESDRVEAQAATPSATTAAPSAFVLDPKPQVEKRESESGTANSHINGGAVAIGAVTTHAIRSGTAAYEDAVAAARAALARGDLAAAKGLSAAIVARYGVQRLPPDLRQLNP